MRESAEHSLFNFSLNSHAYCYSLFIHESVKSGNMRFFLLIQWTSFTGEVALNWIDKIDIACRISKSQLAGCACRTDNWWGRNLHRFHAGQRSILVRRCPENWSWELAKIAGTGYELYPLGWFSTAQDHALWVKYSVADNYGCGYDHNDAKKSNHPIWVHWFPVTLDLLFNNIV